LWPIGFALRVRTTDASGQFKIPLAPVGRWPLNVWRECTGKREDAAGKMGRKIVEIAQLVTDPGKLDLGP
jgi:hypothetical protein